MSKFVHWNDLPKVELGRSQFCFLLFFFLNFINKSKIAIKCDSLQLFNAKLEGVQALSELARRANSTSELKICPSQWNKIPVYSCIGHKMGGFKLVTFPCLEKLSHTQHSILPWALSPGTSVALSELEEYHRERMVHLKHIKNLPKSFLYSENRCFPDGKRALFPAVCICNLASQKHLGSAQLTDSCPLEFFLEISEPTEWEKALGFNILKKYFKD